MDARLEETKKRFADPIANKDYHELKDKLTTIFEERNISFYEAFQHLFTTISKKSDYVSLKDFR